MRAQPVRDLLQPRTLLGRAEAGLLELAPSSVSVVSIPHEHAPDHCDACRRADLEAQVHALRSAAEAAWVLIEAGPNVSHRARAGVLGRLQTALQWGVFTEPPVEEDRG